MDLRSQVVKNCDGHLGGEPMRVLIFIVIAAAIVALVGWEAYDSWL